MLSRFASNLTHNDKGTLMAQAPQDHASLQHSVNAQYSIHSGQSKLNQISKLAADNPKAVFVGTHSGTVVPGDKKNQQGRTLLRQNLHKAIRLTLKDHDVKTYEHLFVSLLDNHINIEQPKIFGKKALPNKGANITALTSDVNNLVSVLEKAKEGHSLTGTQRDSFTELSERMDSCSLKKQQKNQLKTLALAAMKYGVPLDIITNRVKLAYYDTCQTVDINDLQEKISKRISRRLQEQEFGRLDAEIAEEVARDVCKNARLANHEEIGTKKIIDQQLEMLRLKILHLTSSDVKKDRLHQKAERLQHVIKQIVNNQKMSMKKKLELLKSVAQLLDRISELHERSDELPEVGDLSLKQIENLDQAFQYFHKYANMHMNTFVELRVNNLLPDHIATTIINIGKTRPDELANKSELLTNALEKIVAYNDKVDQHNAEQAYLGACKGALPHLQDMAKVAREIMRYKRILDELASINARAGLAMAGGADFGQVPNLLHHNLAPAKDAIQQDSHMLLDDDSAAMQRMQRMQRDRSVAVHGVSPEQKEDLEIKPPPAPEKLPGVVPVGDNSIDDSVDNASIIANLGLPEVPSTNPAKKKEPGQQKKKNPVMRDYV